MQPYLESLPSYIDGAPREAFIPWASPFGPLL